MERLTHSRMQSFKTCRRRSFYAYEHGIRSVLDGRALRMGSAFHTGVEALTKTGGDLATAVQDVRTYYQNSPEEFDDYAWAIERETVIRLICGYQWRWSVDDITYEAVELPFELPLRNPETNRTTKDFKLAGKIDAIIRFADGRLAVKETKLLGDPIDAESNLWRRLRIDEQISLYVVAARKLGYPVESVYYDVARKPTIQPNPIPIVDADGLKIVCDAHGNRIRNAPLKAKKSCEQCKGAGVVSEDFGPCPCTYGKWRQTASTDDGYALHTRLMTPDEFGERLNNDIAERPDFYYHRREVARLDKDLTEFEQEIWEIKDTLRDAQKKNRWYRTANRNTCDYCPVFDLCTVNFDPTKDHLPERFVQLSDPHPELKKEPAHVPTDCTPLTPAPITALTSAEIAAEGRSAGAVSYF
jgi:hypothetical protein